MDFLISNIVPILIIVALAIFLLARHKNKKDAALKVTVRQRTEDDAKAKGIQVTAQADGSVRSGEVLGSTDYKGTTAGIDWTLRSSVSVSGRGRSGNSWSRMSMWRTAATKLPAEKFILIVSTPAEMKAGPIARGGFMNDLINKAADVLLDVYVGGYFGKEYKSLVNIGEDGVKLERPALNDFMILTNHESLANKYLDESTTSTIANWKRSSMGFSREGKVDNFGLLFAPDGVILSCQANMANAEEVRLFSDFGVALVVKMKSVLGG